MRDFFKEEFDELVLTRNPRGGRPTEIGKIVFKNDDDTDCNGVPKPCATIRYHLGYCRGCGSKIIISQERAEHLMYKLKKQGIEPKKYALDWRLKLVKFLLPNLVGVEKK